MASAWKLAEKGPASGGENQAAKYSVKPLTISKEESGTTIRLAASAIGVT